MAASKKKRKERVRRPRRWPLFLVLAVLLAGGTFWAGLVVGRQQAVPEEAADKPVFVTVTEQSVGRDMTLGVSVRQEHLPVAANLLAGVLTSVSSKEEFAVGDMVYAVDGAEVRVIKGASPFYRDLGLDMTGADVQQLNDALVELGYMRESGNKYTWVTEEAIKQWQYDLGKQVTGMVMRGELLAVKSLPTRLVIDEEVASVGTILSGGEAFVLTPSSTPEFSVSATPSQFAAIPPDAKVSVQFGQEAWDAVVIGSEEDVNGNPYFILAAPDGGVVCGKQCEMLPAQETLRLLAHAEIVAPISGSAVPIASLRMGPNGAVHVLVKLGDQTGQSGDGGPVPKVENREVTVLATQDGIAIVEGVQPGEEVQLFGPEQPGNGSPDFQQSTQ